MFYLSGKILFSHLILQGTVSRDCQHFFYQKTPPGPHRNRQKWCWEIFRFCEYICEIFRSREDIKQGCGSGSAGIQKEIFFNKCKKIAKNCKFIQFFKSKLAQSSIVSYFWAIFCVFYNYKKTLHEFIFFILCKAGSGSAFFKQLDPDPNSE